MSNDYELITTQTLGSNVAELTLTSIPTTYTDLVLTISGLDAVGSYDLRFNSDTGTNYSTTLIFGNGSTATPARITNSAAGVRMMRSSGVSGGGGYCYIQNYSDTSTYKSALSRNFGQYPIVWISVGLWRSTSAITSMTIDTETGGLLLTGTVICLYGVRT